MTSHIPDIPDIPLGTKTVAILSIPCYCRGLIKIRRHIFGGLYSEGALIFGALMFGGHFVLVSKYQDLLLCIAMIGKKVFLGQNYLHLALKSIYNRPNIF